MAGRHRERDMHYCHAPCRLQSWLGGGRRRTEGHVFLCTFVTTVGVNTIIQRRNSIFRIKDFSSLRHTQKTNNKNLHTCSLLHSLNLPYHAVLFMKGCSVKRSSWCSCQSHHYSTRPEKQSWRLSTATFTFLPHLKMLTHLYCIFPPELKYRKARRVRGSLYLKNSIFLIWNQVPPSQHK